MADNLDQRIARLPAIAYGFVVRWTVPEMRSMAQFLLVLSGVLLGTAATLLADFRWDAIADVRSAEQQLSTVPFRWRLDMANIMEDMIDRDWADEAAH